MGPWAHAAHGGHGAMGPGPRSDGGMEERRDGRAVGRTLGRTVGLQGPRQSKGLNIQKLCGIPKKIYLNTFKYTQIFANIHTYI